MTTDRRLLDQGADQFEAALLRSAQRDGASATPERTLIALGAGFAAGGATSASTASATIGASKAGAAATGKAAALSALKTLPAVKVLAWLGLGAAGAAVTLAVIHSRSLVSPAPRLDPASGAIAAPPPRLRSPVPTSNGAAANPESPALAGQSMLVEPAVSDAVLHPDHVRWPVAPRTGAPDVASVRRGSDASNRSAGREEFGPAEAQAEQGANAPPDGLLEEVSILDRARLRLSRLDAAGALQDADTYLARFPEGQLAGEAMVIRIRASSISLGRSTAARLAESFLQQHPDSPYAASLRQMFPAHDASPDRDSKR
jgi:hypothetical protein